MPNLVLLYFYHLLIILPMAVPFCLQQLLKTIVFWVLRKFQWAVSV